MWELKTDRSLLGGEPLWPEWEPHVPAPDAIWVSLCPICDKRKDNRRKYCSPACLKKMRWARSQIRKKEEHLEAVRAWKARTAWMASAPMVSDIPVVLLPACPECSSSCTVFIGTVYRCNECGFQKEIKVSQ
jgi:hypothetical protein